VRRRELGPVVSFAADAFVAALRALFRIRVTGIEHLPTDGGAVVAANHVSPLDGVILAAVVWWKARRVTRFVTAAEFFRKPVFGAILRGFGQIPIRRGQQDVGALDAAIASAASGSVVGIFPEGRVNDVQDGPLQPGRSGVARIALAARVPVVPVAIWGTQDRWPRSGLRWTRPFRMRVVCSVGPPIEVEGDDSSIDAARSATEQIMVALERQVAEARGLAGA
jgi:1-acyl-sn-glycerol-3-phosphate acyltransferase